MEQKLSYSIFRTKDVTKAVVFVIHGMQEHKDRYRDFANYLNSRQIAAVIYSLPGHKGSIAEEGVRGWFGDTDGWKTLVGSAVEIANMTRKEFPGVPIYCFGHSMGTMIGRVFLQNYDHMIDGIVLSGAPGYNPGAKVGKILAQGMIRTKGGEGHSKMLDQMVTGSFNKCVKDPKTPVDWLSYNTKNVQEYQKDEWCGFPFTISGYRDLFNLMILMNDPRNYHCTKNDLPILFVAGEEDPCTGGKKGMESSIKTLNDSGYKNISKKIYPHMRHEILNECNRMEVMKDVADWILQKCETV